MLLAAIVLCAYAYLSNITDRYFFDDIPHVATNASLDADDAKSLYDAALSSTAGPTGRPVAMLTFGVERLLFGKSASVSKAINVLLHLACGLLTWLLVARLISIACPSFPRKQLLAAVVAGIWLLHPLHVSTVLYAVQRMAILSHLLSLAAMLAYLGFRTQKTRRGQWACGTATVIFIAVAVLAKENAAILPVILLLIEYTLINSIWQWPNAQRVIGHVALALAVVSIAAFCLLGEWITGGYANRPFDLEQRLLTESRVMWVYMGDILLPSVSDLGLFRDDIEVSRKAGLAEWVAILGLCGLAWAGVILTRVLPLAGFGIACFLAGHVIESSVLALEIAFEHRNYSPSLGLLLAAAAGTVSLFKHAERSRSLLTAGTALYCLVLTATLFMRTADWGDHERFLLAEAAHHPGSFRANQTLGEYAMERYFAGNAQQESLFLAGVQHLRQAATLRPDRAEPLLALVLAGKCRSGRIDDQPRLELERRLAASMRANLVPWFQTYSSGKENCGLSPEWVDSLFGIALENPRLGNRSRVELALLHALALRNSGQPDERIEHALQRAVALAPAEPRAHLYLAYHYLETGRFGAAKHMLDLALALDTSGRYREEISAARTWLRSTSGNEPNFLLFPD